MTIRGSDSYVGNEFFIVYIAHIRPIVIAAASTGIAKISKKDVTKTDQTYKGRLFIYIDSSLKNKIVQIKLIDAKIEEVPTK